MSPQENRPHGRGQRRTHHPRKRHRVQHHLLPDQNQRLEELKKEVVSDPVQDEFAGVIEVMKVMSRLYPEMFLDEQEQNQMISSLLRVKPSK